MSSSIDSLFPQAVQRHQGGDLAGAEQIYRRILAIDPSQPDALHLLGLVLSTRGEREEAIKLIRKAINVRPNFAPYFINLGEILRLVGKAQEAESMLRRGLSLDPNFAEGHFNLANTLRDLGRRAEAEQVFRSLIAAQPRHGRAQFNLANLLREEGRLVSAIEHYRRALEVNPRWRDAHLNIGAAYLDQRELASAENHYRQALIGGPEDDETLGNLASVHIARGEIDKAADCYRATAPRLTQPWLGRLRLATLCPPILRDEPQIDELRDKLSRELDELEATAPASLPCDDIPRLGGEPPMAFGYHGRDDKVLWERIGGMLCRYIQPDPPPRLTGVPRLGVVVTHGHEGVFAQCLGELVVRLPSPDFRVALIASRAGVNVLRHLLKDPPLEFIALPTKLSETVDALRGDRFDHLHYWEIGTDPTNYFLPMFRLAGSQSGCWGWPVSSGLAGVDYHTSSALLESEGADAYYSERLIRLPRLPSYYKRPEVPSSLEPRAAFGLAKDDHVYLCHQNVRKWAPAMDAALANILEADAKGRIVLLGDQQPTITEMLLARLERSLPGGRSRIHVAGWQERARYLNLLAVSDVAIDSFPYSGGANTIADAAAARLPTVTLEGRFARGRYTAAANRLLGVEDLIATEPSDYVTKAVRVANDTDYRRDLANRIGEAAEALYEDQHLVTAFREFFLAAIAASRSGETLRS